MDAVPIDVLTETISRIFTASGLSERPSRVVAGSLVDADCRGIPSHGAMLVPMYVERIRRGSVSTAQTAEVVADLAAVATLDGRNALGQLTGDQAMRLAVAKSKEFGIGAVTVRHAFHFGGAFRYVLAAAEQGCVGLAAANTRPLMPAPGGAAPVVGNNPLALAAPVPGRAPIVLDMALSEAALGKVRIAAAEGRQIPATWSTDADGVPTTDPTAALAGMLLPAGGPKGYGLAVMVDVLTGVLSGGAFGAGVSGLYADTAVPNDCAHFFLALDPAAFGGTFEEQMRTFATNIANTPAAPGIDRVYLPGELEALRHEKARVEGVRLEPAVRSALIDTARSLGVELAIGGVR
ncbi:LDH2 family malate/lactate/ureidoglycolate dehydrogenase [Kibdelosporangium banguiense]|uniref:LDH2 family malate/lactate/ureidoglycolate dehydrogenase n=1 Tax=Kibdelosporangium banguiense TaxID=1365924 RepID=A0ABS4TVB0_9PSEU|nr:Ldh family oxidoreductase [Kibdelosporangium banguiense]MBP2327878.1 LDH2 family malate/lactate/ureidoglycolate dehydrogenase [Kibdelosporangium banguiense]